MGKVTSHRNVKGEERNGVTKYENKCEPKTSSFKLNFGSYEMYSRIKRARGLCLGLYLGLCLGLCLKFILGL